MSETKHTTAYSRLCQWRDVGDGRPTYCAGDADFGNDVKALLAAHADALTLAHGLVGAITDKSIQRNPAYASDDIKWLDKRARAVLTKRGRQP